MESKILLSHLAASMSQSLGKSKKHCEEFLREFFHLISETLENGESVKVKGFGTFKVVDVESRESVSVNTGERLSIASYKKISFTPARELASLINSPFESFESIEIDEDMPDDVLAGNLQDDSESKIEEEKTEPVIFPEDISDEDKVSLERLEEGSMEEGEDDLISLKAYELIESEPEQEEIVNNEEAKEEGEPEEIESDEILDEENNEDDMKNKFGIGFFSGAMTSLAVCLIIFMLGCFFGWWPTRMGVPQREVVQQVVPEPMIEEPAVQVEEEPVEEVETSPAVPQEKKVAEDKDAVYDTVTSTRYLTTIARENYGDYNFWPYIYLENESILGHPDRITPGTRVKVPSLSKYGVSPSRKEDVQKAKKEAQAIYARFK